ncbi:alpha-amylase family glycosyl hydrolase [Kitasatospora sp. NPDC093558]|uniref:glycogen debranching protein n=1 Tax=Kitasatospora sp. NPDC093558 TaxID=3155201 RepID=UPI003433A02C
MPAATLRTRTPAAPPGPPATTPGNPLLPGATPAPGGINFTLHAPGARTAALVLFDPDDPHDARPRTEIPFPEHGRVGDVFTMTVPGLTPARTHYGYRVQDPQGPRTGRTADGILLDPYAKLLVGGERWGETKNYRCAVPDATFDWQGVEPPGIAPEDLVVYELHVRGFTRHPSSGVRQPGTYAGLIEKIPYLRDLGVNCVELMPVFEFDETDNPFHDPATGRPLRNFWGYNPVGFFAPKAAYAAAYAAAGAADGGPVRELKELVRELHRAGIEVVLDVVFNHTAEGDHRGPTLSLRGLDDDAFYLHAPDGSYRNLTRTGNTVNANHPITRAFILQCLRYWATEFHIDGFRFDMAPILARGTDGELLANPPLLEAAACDPVLARRKLIAEPFDATGCDLVGRFPHYGRWMEWNTRFLHTVRRFLIGRPATVGDLAARMIGSPDLYAGRGTAASVNFVASHDGFTLADWTSYDRPHNDANGEGGTDGAPDNSSWNTGHEGPTDDPRIRRLRERQRRNALLLLLTAHGVPMLLAGDERARTQQGNNNAYGQDNPISWLDWDPAADRDLPDFVRACLAFRRAHPVLRRAAHPGDTPPAHGGPAQLSWHGEHPHRPDWSHASGLLVLMLHEAGPAPATGDTVLIAASARPGPTTIDLPAAPPHTAWHLFADTAAPPAGRIHPVGTEPPHPADTPLALAGHAVAVLVARPATTTPSQHADGHRPAGGNGHHR